MSYRDEDNVSGGAEESEGMLGGGWEPDDDEDRDDEGDVAWRPGPIDVDDDDEDDCEPDDPDSEEVRGALDVLHARAALSCQTCRYWAPGDLSGECRRRTPSVADEDGNGYWPVTEPDEWCGEYEPVTEFTPRGAARSRA